MADLFSELFLGVNATSGQKQPVRPVQPPKPAPKPAQKPAAKKTKKTEKPVEKPMAEGEGTDVCAVHHEQDEAYAIKQEPKGDILLQNVERACGGNRYLEAMVLGEILNSPRFKSGPKK